MAEEVCVVTFASELILSTCFFNRELLPLWANSYYNGVFYLSKEYLYCTMTKRYKIRHRILKTESFIIITYDWRNSLKQILLNRQSILSRS